MMLKNKKKEQQLNALVIDDDEQDFEILQRHLEKISEWTISATWLSHTSGLLNSKALREANIIFLDYLLGAQTGLETVKSIRSSGNILPIITLTGQGDEHIAVELLQAGADDYLIKSHLTPARIHRSINSSLTRYETDVVRKKSEKATKLYVSRLKELDHQKSEFVSTVSHELRTPLGIIREYVSLLRDKVAGSLNEKQIEITNSVLKNCDRLGKLIDDVLDFQRLEAGRLRIHRKKTDLLPLLQELNQDFQLRAKSKSQNLESYALKFSLPFSVTEIKSHKF